jgi:small subunit ribosomal protein S4
MKKQKKKYSRPQKPFDKVRIEDENQLREKYGLKTKREIWKADAAIKRIRNLAKNLITASDEEKQAFIERLQKKGFPVESIADTLALDKEDWLKRRLQTIVHTKKLTTTAKQARQLIAHKHVSIGKQVVNIPSYQVSLEEETDVKLDLVLKIPENKKAKIEKIKKEVLEKDISDEDVSEEVLEKAEAPEAVSEEVKEEAPVEEVVEEKKEEVESISDSKESEDSNNAEDKTEEVKK